VNIGLNIKAMREEIGMNQVELAAKVGVTQSMICQIERGTKACTMQLGAEIANALGCEIGDLITA
jgi:DNA-binding XRE family transcriptional regulator